LPPAAAPSAASFTHRAPFPTTFAGSNAAAASHQHQHQHAAATQQHQQHQQHQQGHHGRKWTTVLQQQQQQQHEGPYAYSPAPSVAPVGGLLSQLQERQAQRQRERVRDLLLRAVGGAGQGGGAGTQVLERPAATQAPVQTEQLQQGGVEVASPEWFTTWMDGDSETAAAAAGTLLTAPPAPAAFVAGEGSPYEEGMVLMEGQQAEQEPEQEEQEEEEEEMFRYQAAVTLLMDTYLGPVAGPRPVPVSAPTATVVAIRPPLRTGAPAAVVTRPAWSLSPSELQQQQQQQQQQQHQHQQRQQRQAGLLTRAVRGYTSLLEKHYHLVSFLQATLLGVIGDMIAQCIETAMARGGLGGLLARGFRPNLVRTGNVALLAAVIGAWGFVTQICLSISIRITRTYIYTHKNTLT
jgi:hypothetical protein